MAEEAIGREEEGRLIVSEIQKSALAMEVKEITMKAELMMEKKQMEKEMAIKEIELELKERMIIERERHMEKEMTMKAKLLSMENRMEKEGGRRRKHCRQSKHAKKGKHAWLEPKKDQSSSYGQQTESASLGSLPNNEETNGKSERKRRQRHRRRERAKLALLQLKKGQSSSYGQQTESASLGSLPSLFGGNHEEQQGEPDRTIR